MNYIERNKFESFNKMFANFTKKKDHLYSILGRKFNIKWYKILKKIFYMNKILSLFFKIDSKFISSSLNLVPITEDTVI